VNCSRTALYVYWTFLLNPFTLITFFFVFVRYWRKKIKLQGDTPSAIPREKKAYDSVRRKVLYNILVEFGVS
jgi:hypothetical protein